ncbi:hypothetical protein STANM309S_00455 [Streptomyces tanashiensis]
MNKPLRRVAIFCGLLVLALLLRDNWLQLVRADELNAHPKNRRVQIERYSNERGNIIVDGKPITGSVDSGDKFYKFKRTYLDGPMWAPVTGYASQAYDANQIEKIEDGILTGNDDRLFFDRTLAMFTGEKRRAAMSSPPSAVPRRRPPTRASAARPAPSSPSSRRPARSWRWRPRPRTTPPPSPATPARTRRPGSRWRRTRTSRS